MADAMRAMLDELMGKDRDALPDQKRKRKAEFDDPEICPYFVAGFCPHEMFTNTKSDLGPCEREHEEDLRNEFLTVPDDDPRKLKVEQQFYEYLDKLAGDVDRKIKRSLQRLDAPPSDMTGESLEKVEALTTQIQTLLKQMEVLGEEGEVDKAQQLMNQITVMKIEKEKLMTSGDAGQVNDKERRMQVCITCGAMYDGNDTDKRIASHIEGKQHSGYQRIRTKVAELSKKRGIKKSGEFDVSDSMTYRKDRGGASGGAGYERGDRGDRGFDRDRGDRQYDRGGDRRGYDRGGGAGGGGRDRDYHGGGGHRGYNRDSGGRDRYGSGSSSRSYDRDRSRGDRRERSGSPRRR